MTLSIVSGRFGAACTGKGIFFRRYQPVNNQPDTNEAQSGASTGNGRTWYPSRRSMILARQEVKMTAADDAVTPSADGNSEAAATETVAAAEPTATEIDQNSTSPKPSKKSAPEDKVNNEPPPPPDPSTCKGIVIGQLAFEQSVLAGEFDNSAFLFYLEPAGVLNANLWCTRAYPAESIPGGILMTKAAREAKKVFFDDGVNPDEYELGFPKEFGYVKSIQHYLPESREHAKFPWSKKY